uniref:Uncharacterized protein n=1 Tax=Anguilla anguilla TaxID=7936 RepID=A0A0E9WS44_ANGAN
MNSKPNQLQPTTDVCKPVSPAIIDIVKGIQIINLGKKHAAGRRACLNNTSPFF